MTKVVNMMVLVLTMEVFLLVLVVNKINGDRDKHWEQLLFISGPSSPGAVFFSYWIWAQGQRLVEWG